MAVFHENDFVLCVSRPGETGTGFAEEKSSTEGCQSCTRCLI